MAEPATNVLEYDDDILVCWSCGMPQPEDYRQALHEQGCPDHDPETCIVCVQAARGEVSE